MTIDVDTERLMPLSKVPKWCEKRIGNRVHPSVVHRWRIRGVAGYRLDTIKMNGLLFTSHEALVRFFDHKNVRY